MEVKKIGLPSILSDNDMLYVSHIVRLIEKLDSRANVTIIKTSTYRFIVRPSNEEIGPDLISELRELHIIWGMGIQFQKAHNSTIDFSVK